jgi:hypothetical protein
MTKLKLEIFCDGMERLYKGDIIFLNSPNTEESEQYVIIKTYKRYDSKKMSIWIKPFK